MLWKSSLTALLSLTTVGIGISMTQVSQAQNTAFVCTTDSENIPTTYAQASNGAIPIFKWKDTSFPPPYTPMRRCQEVTQRLNNFKAQGVSLKNFQSGKVNNQSVICVGACDARGSNLLFTLRPDQNPNQVLQALVSSSKGAGGFLVQSSTGFEEDNSCSASTISQNQDGTVIFDLESYLELCSTQTEAINSPTPSNSTSNSPEVYTPATPTGAWGD